MPLLVDAAQTAGIRRSACSLDGISFWAASAHKGLLGPPGVGVLYVHEGMQLTPLVSGGTGSASESLDPPEAYPDHLEAGTAPVPAIVGLGAGLEFINKIGAEKVLQHELGLTDSLVEWIDSKPGIKRYGAPNPRRRLPTVAFGLQALGADRLADLLDAEYGIAVRAGLHCAAMAHTALRTTKGGLVRASVGYFNTSDDIQILCEALERLGGL